VKYGIWMPIFGGWLRNVKDENMPVTFDYVKKVANLAEELGFHMTLIPEVNLNDIKGVDAPGLDAWSLTAAVAAVTSKLQILSAIRPGFYNPALLAKAAATVDEISQGRLSLNIVSAWWAEEARQYGGIFTEHDDRYARTEEFIAVLKGLWTQTPFTFKGKYYEYENTYMLPKPLKGHIPLYAGGESEAGRQTIAKTCDSYVMHGGTVQEIADKIRDMNRRRQALQKEPFETFGMAAFVICRDTEEEALAEKERITRVHEGSVGYDGYQDFISKSQLNVQVSLEDYSVSNRGLRPNLVGTPEQIAKRILEYEEVGLNLLILQFSPHHEGMETFAKKVMPLVEELRHQKEARR